MYEAILQIIATHDGEHSWYTLDRTLAGRFDVSTMLIPALTQLAKDGLIEARGPAQMPKYWITDQGRAYIGEAARVAVA